MIVLHILFKSKKYVTYRVVWGGWVNVTSFEPPYQEITACSSGTQAGIIISQTVVIPFITVKYCFAWCTYTFHAKF